MVIAVAAILVSATSLSLHRSIGVQRLTAITNHLARDMQMAAQLAATGNRTVYLTFLTGTGSGGEGTVFSGWQMQSANPGTGVIEPMGERVTLDPGIVFLDHEKFSNLLHRERAGAEPCAIPFKPGGGTGLPRHAGQRWCVSLAQEVEATTGDAETLPPGSRTIVVNPHTGAVTVY